MYKEHERTGQERKSFLLLSVRSKYGTMASDQMRNGFFLPSPFFSSSPIARAASFTLSWHLGCSYFFFSMYAHTLLLTRSRRQARPAVEEAGEKSVKIDSLPLTYYYFFGWRNCVTFSYIVLLRKVVFFFCSRNVFIRVFLSYCSIFLLSFRFLFLFLSFPYRDLKILLWWRKREGKPW